MALMTITSFMTGIKNWVLGKIGAITDLIPLQASSSNKLADKAFVNSSIATATATFRGSYNVVSDLSLSYNATHAQIQTALATKMSALSITPDNNDYAFVQIPTADATPTQIAKIEKYKYNGTDWAFEYELNNSGFTAAQWAAINSGATLELIGKLQALPTNAQLTEMLNGKVSWTDNGAYDVTAHNSGATFASLSALLNSENLDTLIPIDIRRDGMSIKFVHSSDNKYIQCRLMANEFSTDVKDWQDISSLEKATLLGYELIETPIDLNEIETTNLGYYSSSGKFITMDTEGYYSKFVPVEEDKTYIIAPTNNSHRVSLIPLITKPTAPNQAADTGTECIEQYGVLQLAGELGMSYSLKIHESRFLYVRVDTAPTAPSCVGSVTEITIDNSYDEEDSYPSILKDKDGKVVLPITKSEIITYKEGTVYGELNKINNQIGYEGLIVRFASAFEKGAINAGNDEDSDECMRTPSASPITLLGIGKIRCIFTVPYPRANSPWSKPYFYKDGVLVDAYYPAFQVNNGTVWEHDCDGSYNEIRWRVYVSDVSNEAIAASSIACTYIEEGSGILKDIKELQEKAEKVDNARSLYLGKLLQSSYNTTGATGDSSTDYVCMSDVLQVPFKGATLSISTTDDIKVGLRFGSVGDNIGSPIWCSDKDIHITTSSEQYYHLVFAKVDNEGQVIGTITLSEVMKLIEEEKIAVTYTVEGEDNILLSCPDAEIKARAFKTLDNLPTFCHTSDQHGNICGLEYAYEFARYVGVNALINTGDLCSQVPINGYEYAASLKNKYDFPTLVAVGNHEGYQVTGEADIRSEFLDKFITADYHISNGKTYYYYDMADINLRFIVLNTSQTGYSTFNNSGCIKQDQIDFLVSTLLSVPSGYGVVICCHFPLVKKELMVPNDYGFMNDWAGPSWEKTLPFASSLQAIIDAYIGRTTFDISYTNTNDGKMNDGSGTSVSKTGDFTNAMGEFICWMTGHTHQDRVAYFADTTYKQLCLNITCTASCEWQTTYDNIPRKGDGVCRNAFNIYTINRAEKKVYITRVGSDFASDGKDRKFAIISYAD